MVRQGLSQRAYARRRGCSHTGVQKAIRTGRISTWPDGSIDPERADLEWIARSADADGNLAHGPVPLIAESRARREAALAGLAELDLAERLGELLNVEEAEEDYRELLMTFNALILGGPGRYAHLIACDCHQGADSVEAVEKVLLALRRDLRQTDATPKNITRARKKEARKGNGK